MLLTIVPFVNDNLGNTKPFGVRFDREELPYFKQRRLEEIGGRTQFLHHWEVGLPLDRLRHHRETTRGPFRG